MSAADDFFEESESSKYGEIVPLYIPEREAESISQQNALITSRDYVCPHCNRDVRDDPARFPKLRTGKKKRRKEQSAPAVQTIEKTSKTWKGLFLFSGGMIFFGLVLVVIGVSSRKGDAIKPGAAMGIIGAIIYFYARAMAWWNHG